MVECSWTLAQIMVNETWDKCVGDIDVDIDVGSVGSVEVDVAGGSPEGVGKVGEIGDLGLEFGELDDLDDPCAPGNLKGPGDQGDVDLGDVDLGDFDLGDF